jgi:IS4 transposase
MDVGDLATNPIAQIVFLILSAAGGYQVWRAKQPAEAKERADSSGQIAALATWQALLVGERTARVRAEERADKFAAERNEALEQVWEMKGQFKVMSETLAAQTAELGLLREQVRQLKEQIHAQ